MEFLLKDFKRAAAVTTLLTAAFAGAACGDRGSRPQSSSSPSSAPPQNGNGAVIVRGLCVYGCPEGAPDGNRVIERPLYTLSNNSQTKFADWVAYRITRETIGPTRPRNWHRDPDLPPDETLRPSDYKAARSALNVDRGHQAPVSSLAASPHWKHIDYLSNVTPQSVNLNQGPWERLEDAERRLVEKTGGAVYAVTGPLYERPMSSLPFAHISHKVPSGYWKVIAVGERTENFKVVSFIFDQQTPRKADFCDGEVSVREIETRTGLNIFPRQPERQRVFFEERRGKLGEDMGCRGSIRPPAVFP